MRKSITKSLLPFACVTLLCSALTTLAHANPIRILPLGDSITQGIGGEKSYRKPLIEELDRLGCGYEMVGSRSFTNGPSQELPPIFQSRHEGYSGHGVNDFLNATHPSGIPNPGIDSIMDNQMPDVLLVHLGSNDMHNSQPVLGPLESDGTGGTIKELESLVTRIWNKNPDAEILIANVIPWFGSSFNPSISSDISELGDEIETWVAGEADTRLHLVDVRSGYLAPTPTSPTSPYMNPDNIHPNQAGDAHIADAFIQVITDNDLCPEGVPPQTFISSPTFAGQALPETHTFTGTATDAGGSGFSRVRIAIEDDNHTSENNRWFNFNTGEFGSFQSKNAGVSNVTTSTLDWQITATMPDDGSYTIYALAIDNAGNQDYTCCIGLWPTSRQFVVVADSISPMVSITTPDANDVLPVGSYNFSGSATDAGGSGFKFVRFAILNRSLGQWYNFNNSSFSGASGNGAISANLSNTNASSTDWNYSLSLPAGEYSLAVRTFDNANNPSAWTIRRFSVQNPDVQSPVTVIDSPDSNDVLPVGSYNFSGSATDAGGSGFKFVRFAILNRSLGQWYNFNNSSFSGASGNGAISANLSNTNASSTDWNYSLSLPAGEYSLAVRTFDNANNPSAWTIRRFSVQNPDVQSPVTVIDSPDSNDVLPVGSYNFSGSATDAGGSGFKFVRFAILNRSLGQWYNFNNSSFSGASGNGAISANLSNTNASSTNWNYSLSLPAGEYSLAVRTFDNANNPSAWTIRRFSVQTPDVQSPVTVIDSPDSNDVLPVGSYNFSGSATDAGGSGFKFVRFAILNRSLGQWYNFNNSSFSGASGNGAISANLSNTNASSTDWNYSLSLPAGEYSLAVRTFDNANNPSAWTIRRFSVQNPDVQSPVTVIDSPDSNDVLPVGSYNFSGSATDAGGSGFKFVRFAILNRSLGQWYNFNNSSFSGASGNGAISANLSNTNDSSTDWNYSLSLPAGEYSLAVRTFDNANNPSAWTIRRFSVQ